MNKSAINRRIIRSIKKIFIASFVLVFSVSLTKMGNTNSGFLDLEESSDNQILTGSLDMKVTSGEDELEEPEDAEDMIPKDVVGRTATVSNVGTIDFQYKVEFQKIAGDDELCAGLLLTAEKDGSVVYDGLSLSAFDLNVSPALANSENDDWTFEIELPEDASGDWEEMNCDFDFVFTAWQTVFVDSGDGWVDEEKLENNEIESGEWEIDPGEVVINEVMWMGSDGHSGDEWIELRNMTDVEVDLTGWKIENAGSSGGSITIPSGILSANGYFLISHYDEDDSSSNLNSSPDYVTSSLSLSNDDNGNLVLRNSSDEIIDQALGESDWPAGENGSDKQSMERQNVPGDGLVATNWYTCNSPNANDDNFWDVDPSEEGKNFGTPGAVNLHPIVMNEIMINPAENEEEWIELYNISEDDWDATGWYFENKAGDQLVINEDNAESEETVVSGEGFLVVHNNQEDEFMKNDGDRIRFYDNAGTAEDREDDILIDEFEYMGEVKENKTFVRLPDGLGPWIDPDPTPGEKNQMNEEDIIFYQLVVLEECFDGRKFDEKTKNPWCQAVFVRYLGLLEDIDDEKMDKDLYEELSGEKDKLEKEKEDENEGGDENTNINPDNSEEEEKLEEKIEMEQDENREEKIDLPEVKEEEEEEEEEIGKETEKDGSDEEEADNKEEDEEIIEEEIEEEDEEDEERSEENDAEDLINKITFTYSTHV